MKRIVTLFLFTIILSFMVVACGYKTTLSYSVTGTAENVSLRYIDGSGETIEETIVQLPYRKSFEIDRGFEFQIYVTNVSGQGNIECQVFEDEQLLGSAKGDGFAGCEGSLAGSGGDVVLHFKEYNDVFPPSYEASIAQTSTSTPEPTAIAEVVLPTEIIDAHDVPMILVNAGDFELGGNADAGLAECRKYSLRPESCQREWFVAEEPVHAVALDDYYIDQYEVTNAMFMAFLQDIFANSINSSLKPDDKFVYVNEYKAYALICADCGTWEDRITWDGSDFQVLQAYANHPVTLVTWYGAQTYCEWREARLPTEAEWEKAARGSVAGQQYLWGDEFVGEQANFCDDNCSYDWKQTDLNDGYEYTAPVGNYTANDDGLYDMAGNVWEWVEDWYDVYPGGDAEASDDFGRTNRILRGGAWDSTGTPLRVSHRGYASPDIANYTIGFRCAYAP